MKTRSRLLQLTALPCLLASGCAIDAADTAPGPDEVVEGPGADTLPELEFPSGLPGDDGTVPSDPPSADPGDPAPAGSACAFSAGADPERAVLALEAAGTLRFIYADGSYETVYELPTSSEWGPTSVQIEAVGGWVISSHVVPGEEPEDGYYAGNNNLSILFDATGETRWEQVTDASATPYYGGYVLHQLGADGTTVTPLMEGVRLTDSAGEFVTLESYRALGPVVDGLLPVAAYQVEPGREVYGWYDREAGTLRPLEDFEAVRGRLPTYSEGAFMTQVDGGDVARLRLDRPDGTQWIDLPARYEPGEDLIWWRRAGDWLLTSANAEGGEGDLVNLETGEVRSLELVLPEGMRVLTRPSYYYYEGRPEQRLAAATIDERGGLLLPLRNDEWGAVFRSADGGATWTQVGERFRGVSTVNVQSVAGSYVIGAAGPNDYYYYEDESRDPWVDSDAPVGFEGGATQLVHGPSGATTLIPFAASYEVRLDDRGECAAYWDVEDGGDGSFLVVDLRTGVESHLFDAPGDRLGARLFDWF